MITNERALRAMEQQIRERFRRLSPTLDERSRRLFAATEALSLGYGGEHYVFDVLLGYLYVAIVLTLASWW